MVNNFWILLCCFLFLFRIYGCRNGQLVLNPGYFNYRYSFPVATVADPRLPATATPSVVYFLGGHSPQLSLLRGFTGQQLFYPIPPPTLFYSVLPPPLRSVAQIKQDGNSRARPSTIIFEGAKVSNTSHLPPVCGRLSTAPDLLQRSISDPPTTDAANNVLTSLEFGGPDMTKTIFGQSMGSRRLVTTKITFGEVSPMNESPWQVAMFTNGKFHCGASIISELHILTAAHCVLPYVRKPKSLHVSLGSWDLKSTKKGMKVKIAKIIPHPDFSYFTLQNDIALIKLTKKIRFSNRIQPVCLPSQALQMDGELMTVTGWGRNEHNLLQTKLQKLTAVVIKNNDCADRWEISGAPRSIIGIATLCMDTQLGDSCKGDSGGPAVIEYPYDSGDHIQAGIVSFGSGSCTDYQLPGVYTRVASFTSWITEQMKL